jgi:hypothetical protein
MQMHMKNIINQQTFETRYALIHCILDTSPNIKKNANEMMQSTRLSHRQIKMCIEAQSGHFEKLLYI